MSGRGAASRAPSSGAGRDLLVAAGSTLGALEGLYLTWLQLLRYLVPLAIITVMLYALGIFELLGLI